MWGAKAVTGSDTAADSNTRVARLLLLAAVFVAVVATGVVAVAETGDELEPTLSEDAERWNATASSGVATSVVYENGRAFFSTTDTVEALNAETGEKLWVAEVAQGGFSPKPAVADGTVYAVGDDGNITALDTESGDVEWVFEAGSQVRSPPRVADGSVLFGDSGGTVYALDGETGRIKWEFTNPSDEIRPIEVYDNRVYVGSADDTVYAIELDDGGFVWSYTLDGGAIHEMDIQDGVLYTASENLQSRDTVLYAIDADDGTPEWSTEVEGFDVVVDGEYVYYRNVGDDEVKARSAADGEKRWSVGLDGRPTAPEFVDGSVYIGTEDFDEPAVYQLDGETGEIVSTVDTESAIREPPRFWENTLYVTDISPGVYAFDISGDVSEPELVIEPFDEQFPDGTAGDDYGEVEIIVEETAGVETNGLEVTVELFRNEDELVFDETIDGVELRGQTVPFEFDVGTLAEPGFYMVVVTADADNADLEMGFGGFELEPAADEPRGTITLEDPIYETQSTFDVEYSFEDTLGGDAFVLIRNDASDEFVGEIVTESGTLTVEADAVGGLEDGDTISAELYNTPDVEILLDEDSVLVGTDEELAAMFDYEPPIPEPDEPVTFDAGDSVSPDGEILEYRWDFTGDETVDDRTTEPTTTHTFDEPGDYGVTLEIKNEAGETAETTRTVTVEPAEKEPQGTITLEDPIYETQSTFDVEYSFENTAEDTAVIGVGKTEADPEEVLFEHVEVDGSIQVDVEEIGGLEAGDEVRAAIWDSQGDYRDVEPRTDDVSTSEIGDRPIIVEPLDEDSVIVRAEREPRPRPAPSDPAFFEVDIDANESRLDVVEGEEIVLVADVTNTGDRLGRTQLRAGVGDTSDTARIELFGGRSTTVEFAFTAELDHDGEDAFVVSEDDEETLPVSVRPPAPANFSVAIDRNASTLDVFDGENATLVVDVTNTGDEPGTQMLLAGVDDDRVATELSLDGGETGTVDLSFAAALEDDGEPANVRSRNDSETTPLNVSIPAPANFTVDIDRNASTLDVFEGELVTAVATVTNVGDEEGTQVVALTDNETVLDSRSVSLERNASETTVFEWDTTGVESGERGLAVRTLNDTDSERVGVYAHEPERSIEETNLSADDTTTVSVTAAFDEPTNFTVADSFDAFDDVSIVDDDGATLSGVTDANDELFASYTDRERATVVFEVGLADGASAGVHSFDGLVDVDGDRIPTVGDDAIEVALDEASVPERSIDDEVVSGGESTTVSIHLAFSEPTEFTVVEMFDAFDDVAIVDDDGADFSSVTDANDELFASYTDREQATLTAEVTTGANASDGDEFVFDGFVDVGGSQTSVDGPDTIAVVESPADVDVVHAERAEITSGNAVGNAQVEFTDDSPVDSVTFDESTTGHSTVTAFDAVPESLGETAGTPVSVVRITVPDAATDTGATVRFRVPVEHVESAAADVDTETLQVVHFTDGEWEVLDTEIVDQTAGAFVLEAETDGFSHFAVTADDGGTSWLPLFAVVALAFVGVGFAVWRRVGTTGRQADA